MAIMSEELEASAEFPREGLCVFEAYPALGCAADG
jgi:hypothetical protein